MSNIINIGGTSGGSGSSVVANPQGAATDTLNKLQVDGTIYGVSGGGGHNYSTTEQVVGSWIDGSTLYERTFELSSIITIGTDWSSTGITLTGADKIIDVEVYRIDTLGEFMSAVSLNASTKAVSLLTLWNGVELSAGSTITLRYTKASA